MVPGPYKGRGAWLGTPSELFPGAELGRRQRLLFQEVEQIALPRLAPSKSCWHEPPRLTSFPTSDPCPAPSENSSLAPGLRHLPLPSSTWAQWFPRMSKGPSGGCKGEGAVKDGDHLHTQTCSAELLSGCPEHLAPALPLPGVRASGRQSPGRAPAQCSRWAYRAPTDHLEVCPYHLRAPQGMEGPGPLTATSLPPTNVAKDSELTFSTPWLGH